MTKMNIGFDPGYGYGKGAVEIGGSIVFAKDNSVVAWTIEPEEGTIEFEGRHWFVGEEALIRPNQVEIVNHDLLNTHGPLFLLNLLRKLEIDPDDVGTVGTGLSLAHSKQAEAFRERLSSFEANGRKYSFDIEIIPQAVGAKHALDMTEEERNYAVLDFGSNTVDALVVINGKIQEASRYGVDSRGVFQMAKAVQKYAANNDIGAITLPEAMDVLESKSLFLYGVSYDLADVVEDIKTEYTTELLSYVFKKWDNEIRVLRKIFFVGGGAHLIDKEQLLPHFHIPDKPEYYNAVGNLLALDQ